MFVLTNSTGPLHFKCNGEFQELVKEIFPYLPPRNISKMWKCKTQFSRTDILNFSSCLSSTFRHLLHIDLPISSLNHLLFVMLVTQSCVTLCNHMDCSPPVSSVHGSPQARILEWVAIPFSGIFFQSRDRTQISCNTGRFFTF